MANHLAQYDIAFEGLSEGSHRFDFDLDDSFFSLFDDDALFNVSLKVAIDLVKSETLLTFSFYIRGDFDRSCDRCLEPIRSELNITRQLHVKPGAADDEGSEDEVITIGSNEHQFNIARHIYEYIKLDVPMRIVHEHESDCDQDVLKILSRPDEELATDPRWNKLKELT